MNKNATLSDGLLDSFRSLAIDPYGFGTRLKRVVILQITRPLIMNFFAFFIINNFRIRSAILMKLLTKGLILT